jgi:hypothetical protein
MIEQTKINGRDLFLDRASSYSRGSKVLFRSQVAAACKSGSLAYLKLFLDTIFFFFAKNYPKDIRGMYVGWGAPAHHSRGCCKFR